MSLINKALKDLDKNSNKDPSLSGEKSIASAIKPSIEYKKKPYKQKIILVFLIIIAIFMLFVYWKIRHKTNEIDKFPEITAITKPKLISEVPKVVHVQRLERVTLNDFFLDIENDTANLVLQLTSPVRYFVENNNDNQPIMLTLNDTKLAPGLENMMAKLSQNGWINTLKFEQLSGVLILEILPMPSVELVKIYTKNDLSNQLILEFVNKNNATLIKTSEQAGTIEKVLLQPTKEEITKKQYQQAIDLFSEHKIAEAISKLEQILIDDSGNIVAREALATLLLKINKNSKAKKVLNEGMKIDPENTLFIKLQAQILINEKKFSQALTLLRGHHPSIETDPDYYGFMASLYRQVGKYMIAAKIYQQLSKLQPSNAIWWIGLGASLEGEGEENAAAEAYRGALRCSSDLPPEVRAYAESRSNK